MNKHLAALLLLGLAFSSSSIGAGGWVFLELCKHSSGETIDFDAARILGHEGAAWIRAETIITIVNHHKHKACSFVTLDNGLNALVIGTPHEISCKMSKGPGCE